MRLWINFHSFLTVELVKHFNTADGKSLSGLEFSFLVSLFSLMNTSLLLCHPILSWIIGFLGAIIFIFSLIFHMLKVQVWDNYILIFTHHDYSKPANHFVTCITFIISYMSIEHCKVDIFTSTVWLKKLRLWSHTDRRWWTGIQMQKCLTSSCVLTHFKYTDQALQNVSHMLSMPTQT